MLNLFNHLFRPLQKMILKFFWEKNQNKTQIDLKEVVKWTKNTYTEMVAISILKEQVHQTEKRHGLKEKLFIRLLQEIQEKIFILSVSVKIVLEIGITETINTMDLQCFMLTQNC